MLFIRTDMNEHIATGHMMRCISIANAAREFGQDVLFITSDNKGEELLTANGFEYLNLNSNYLELMQGLDTIKKLVTNNDILLIDTYSRTKEFMYSLRGYVYTAYIDDMGEQVFNVDCIICYPPYYKEFDYEKRYKNCNTRFLLGTRYAPLRQEFIECNKKKINPDIENILIVSGGSDPYNVTPAVIEEILKTELGNLHITAVCGVYSTYYDELCKKYKSQGTNVNIIPSTPKIKQLFDNADVVITAAGTTLYEICATGTPAISYTYADNQIPNADAFCKLNLIPNIGDVRMTRDFGKRCIKELKRLTNPETRRQISVRMQSLVDGNGTYNIIKEFFGESLS